MADSTPATHAPTAESTGVFLSPQALLEHWQGHRALTRRVIEAFPEDQLFTFSVGGMRPFGELAMEMLGMGAPMVRGVLTDEWTAFSDAKVSSREELLRLWDESTAQINADWSQIPADRWQQTMTAFGQYTGTASWLIMYVVDNEIHHRGQGYVYLRALGVEPPPFWDR
jgi:uncharacterized damage-inducible protein DinB